MAKASATIDVTALKVAGEGASKYITEITEGGIKVHDALQQNTNYIQLTSSGMDIYDKGILRASYGNEVIIGNNDEFNMHVGGDSFYGVTPNGANFFNLQATGETLIEKKIIYQVPVGVAGTVVAPNYSKVFTNVDLSSSNEHTIRLAFFAQSTSGKVTIFASPISVNGGQNFNGTGYIENNSNLMFSYQYNNSNKEFTCGWITNRSGTLITNPQPQDILIWITRQDLVQSCDFAIGTISENTEASRQHFTLSCGYELYKSLQTGGISLGQYNAIPNGNEVLTIGNGTASLPSNALVVDYNGNLITQGMAGMIQMFAGSTLPTNSGWLLCNGAEYLKTDYPTLYSVIGDTFGTHNPPSDSDHFRVPDLRGRVPIGSGHGDATGHTAHNLGDRGGNENAIVPYHRHGITSVLETNGVAIATNRVGTVSSGGVTYALRKTNNDIAGVTNTAYSSNDSTNATGANMMPYLTINYIICTGKTS